MNNAARSLLLTTLVMAGLYHARPSSSALVAPVPRRLEIPAVRTQCGKHVPLRITVRALSTPVLGQDLVLQFDAQNRGLTGPFECRLRVNDTMLTPLDEPLSWTRELPEGQVVSWTARVRVNFPGPIPITAKVRSLAPACAGLPPVEGYAILYPFDGTSGQLRPTWNESTLQPLSKPALKTLKLSDTTSAVVVGTVTYRAEP